MVKRAWRPIGIGVFGLCAAGFLTSCTKPYLAYPGPRRAGAQIGVLAPDDGVKIQNVNGQTVDLKPPSDRAWIKYDRIELRPGTYTLTLVPKSIQAIKSFTRLEVTLAAGHHYRVRLRMDAQGLKRGPRYAFWVEDVSTKQAVSDVVDSRNPFAPQ